MRRSRIILDDIRLDDSRRCRVEITANGNSEPTLTVKPYDSDSAVSFHLSEVAALLISRAR